MNCSFVSFLYSLSPYSARLCAPCGLIVMIVSFLFIGLVTLCKLRRSNPNFLSNRAAHKIKETIIRVGESLLIFVILWHSTLFHLFRVIC